MKLVHILILVLAYAGGNGAIAQSTKPTPPAVSAHAPAHLAAAERVIDAMELVRVFAVSIDRSIAQLRVTDPATADLMREASTPYVQRQFLVDELRGFVADQLDADACRAIADFLSGPVGHRHMQAQLEELRTGKPVTVDLSAEEQAVEQVFGLSPAGQDFTRFAAALGPRFGELADKVNAQMTARVRQILEKRSVARERT